MPELELELEAVPEPPDAVLPEPDAVLPEVEPLEAVLAELAEVERPEVELACPEVLPTVPEVVPEAEPLEVEVLPLVAPVPLPELAPVEPASPVASPEEAQLPPKATSTVKLKRGIRITGLLAARTTADFCTETAKIANRARPLPK